MFIKMQRLDGSHSIINVDDISHIDEICQDDTFYHKTTKHCNVIMKNTDCISVAYSMAEIEIKLDDVF